MNKLGVKEIEQILPHRHPFLLVDYIEDYEPGKVEQFFTKIFGDKLESVLMGITMVISVILALGIFMVLPFFLTNLMKGFLPSYSIRTLIEGIIRVALFLIYIWLISKMEDITAWNTVKI